MVTKLSQAKLNVACMAAAERYKAMPTPKEASLAFGYELQGYAAAMVDNGESLPVVLRKITELLDMLAKANGI